MRLLYFAILSVFLPCLCISQEIRVANDVPKAPGNELTFYITNYENKSGLLLQFGDNQEVFLSKGEQSAKHAYDKGGRFVAKLFDVSNTNKVLVMENIEILSKPTKLIIESFVITSYHPVKGDGRAWDNMISGTYPDIFFSVHIADGSALQYLDHLKIENVSPNNLPLELITTPVEIDLPEKFEMLSFAVWDDDSVSDDDRLGSMLITGSKDNGVNLSEFSGKVISTTSQDGKLQVNYKIKVE